jgi:hypothetical protein
MEFIWRISVHTFGAVSDIFLSIDIIFVHVKVRVRFRPKYNVFLSLIKLENFTILY